MGLYAFTLFCVESVNTDTLPNPYEVHDAAFKSLCALLYDPVFWWDTVVELAHD
jgi:hypothetical protein